MNTRTLIVTSAACLLAAPPAAAQNVAGRVNAVRDGRVQFSFPARAGVCGNGRSYLQAGPEHFVGSFVNGTSETMRNDPCVAGPVRVVVDRADNATIALHTYVGPHSVESGVTDLGAVSAQEAASYLVSLAARADGRPARDAILPAMIGEAAPPTSALLGIARDRDRPLEVRRSAMSWLVRAAAQQPSESQQVAEALVRIARDDADSHAARRQALSVLSRMEHGGGLAALVSLARSEREGWLAREANTAAARSGDPRAREYLRTAVRRTDLPDEVLAAIVRGLGSSSYATSQDAAVLREVYPRLTGERSQEAVISTIAELGGAENVRFLMGLARNESERSASRRRAITHAERAGVAVAELVALYDGAGDREVRGTLIEAFARNGARAATDKLVAIARTETDPSLRRRAVSALSRSEDPQVRDALRGIVER